MQHQIFCVFLSTVPSEQAASPSRHAQTEDSDLHRALVEPLVKLGSAPRLAQLMDHLPLEGPYADCGTGSKNSSRLPAPHSQAAPTQGSRGPTTFLPLGPLGQGRFGIMELGKVALYIFRETQSVPAVAKAGELIYVADAFTAFIMLGFWAGVVVFRDVEQHSPRSCPAEAFAHRGKSVCRPFLVV